MLKEKLKNLPDSSGVYIMLDADGNIIYIGKARVLKNRVRQYFHASVSKYPKVQAMVNKIADFRYIITDTDKDALILESTLIKKHKPQYNILLKDDKQYPYIKISTNEPFPRIEITRKLKKDNAKYFGPYMGGISAKSLVSLISEAFLIRTCNRKIGKSKERACLDYHIGRCKAPCENLVSKEEYASQIKRAIAFLKGDISDIKYSLENKMKRASELENFERAIEFRDKLIMLEQLKERRIASLNKNLDADFFALATNGTRSVISVLIVRQGRIQGGENYEVTDISVSESDVFATFIMQYYDKTLIPDKLVFSEDFEFRNELEANLKSKSTSNVDIVITKRGELKNLSDLAKKNAEDYLLNSLTKIQHKEDMTKGAVLLLQKYLHLQKAPRRMECYDISNVSGVDKTASMVVFFDGEKLSSHYRRFKIKTVEGANDFASMKEVITRRLTRLKNNDSDESFGAEPDLIIIDGGKGQLSSAKEAMTELNLNIPIVSLAKREEEIYFDEKKEPLRLPLSDNASKLCVRIRDEAHRFAVSYFRNLHSKTTLKSRLDLVKGVGKKRRIALLNEFATVIDLKNASIEDIAKVDNIGLTLARSIKEQLNDKENG